MHSPTPASAPGRTHPAKSSHEPRPKPHRTRVAILGATGSIGTSSIDVCRHLSDRFEINSLTAVTSWKKLAEQALEARPKKIALNDKSTHDHPSENLQALKDAVLGTGIEVVTGPHAMEEIVRSDDVDTVVAAVVGAAGLAPVIAAAAAGKTIALANKEALVVAGSIVMPTARKHNSTIIPVDSEHSAIFQSLRSGTSAEIRKIILTASGGPFRTWSKSKIEHATVAEALAHPNWKMGPKITIDSATMMNKALEIIEAHWLFDLPAEKIEVLIHPQSIVHSMIEFMDGSVIAQLGTPDMRTPIQYALTHPERFDGCSTRLDWSKIKEMTFEQPDERFPALQLGYEVIRLGGTSGAVVNAANEIANEMFRAGKLRFGQIVERVQEVLARHKKAGFVADPTLEQLLAADHWARSELRSEYRL
ncbi:MAG TPA: 1-deoxy-D-xylulose-5-phosphate reductoisomerase [Phycisphaerae bacterium]|nr:1-deoxy-D-xylulose-5-phosphate reductoisomerase [Phycisphaerae bacterium]